MANPYYPSEVTISIFDYAHNVLSVCRSRMSF